MRAASAGRPPAAPHPGHSRPAAGPRRAARRGWPVGGLAGHQAPACCQVIPAACSVTSPPCATATCPALAAPGTGFAGHASPIKPAGGVMPPAASSAAAAMLSASGIGAALPSSTCQTATASAQPRPDAAHGPPAPAPAAGQAPPPRPRAPPGQVAPLRRAQRLGLDRSVSSRSTWSSRMAAQILVRVAHGSAQPPSWRAMIPRRISGCRRAGCSCGRPWSCTLHFLHLRWGAAGSKSSRSRSGRACS